MPKGKRGSARPEEASTKPPKGPKSSWPKDRRPPKPEKGGDPKASAKEKSPPPKSLEAGVFRKFTPERLAEIASDIVRQLGELRALKDQMKAQASESRNNVVALEAEIEHLCDQHRAGGEDARQADLFAHELPDGKAPVVPQDEPGTPEAPTPAETGAALAAVAQRVEGGNGETLSTAVADALHRPTHGYDFTPAEPAPKVAPFPPSGFPRPA